jgi:hypothetical protein
VEDSVIGNGYKWDQKCYDANWANLHYPGQYNSATSEIVGYPHRHAQRMALTGTWGNTGLIPAAPAVQSPYTMHTVYVIPSNFNADKLKIVAFVAANGNNKFNKWVLNTEEAWVSALPLATGIEDHISDAVITSVYPNPTAGEVTVDVMIPAAGNASLRLYDLTGRIVLDAEPEQHISSGRYITRFDVSVLPAGTYFVKLEGEGFSTVRKLMVH